MHKNGLAVVATHDGHDVRRARAEVEARLEEPAAEVVALLVKLSDKLRPFALEGLQNCLHGSDDRDGQARAE
jgi:hypothetical protein